MDSASDRQSNENAGKKLNRQEDAVSSYVAVVDRDERPENLHGDRERSNCKRRIFVAG